MLDSTCHVLDADTVVCAQYQIHCDVDFEDSVRVECAMLCYR